MSGIKPLSLSNFYRKLHARRRRPRTVEHLAARLFLNRQHLTEVINGTRPGRCTWPRLAKLLTPAELALLGRDKAGGRCSPDSATNGGQESRTSTRPAAAGTGVPQETLSQLRQSAEAAA